jgi:hypothetical protein
MFTLSAYTGSLTNDFLWVACGGRKVARGVRWEEVFSGSKRYYNWTDSDVSGGDSKTSGFFLQDVGSAHKESVFVENLLYPYIQQICKSQKYILNVAVPWLAPLLLIREVPATACPDWGLSWLSSVPPSKFRDSTLIRQRPLYCTSIRIIYLLSTLSFNAIFL